jgi:DNA-directed RNA polymerase subunit RPC12/RpoP
MAGKICPRCGKPQFYKTVGENRKCTYCGHEMIVPPNKNKGGRGNKCSNCNHFTVFNQKCTNCGARYIDTRGK